MKGKNIERGGTLLGITVLAAILYYRNSPHTIMAGALYLVSASCIDLVCLLTIFTVNMRVRLRKVPSVRLLCLQETRAQILFLAASQLAILGMLNIWATEISGSFGIFLLSYLLVGIYIFLSDRLIAIADRPIQDGGAKPLSSFGRPRSRRLFFWAFAVYPMSSLVIAGVLLFTKGRPYPPPFHPPQLCLLQDAAFSAVAAGLVFHRYRGSVADKLLSKTIVLATLLLLGAAAGIQIFLVYSLYLYVLTTFIVICIAISVYWLSRADKRDSALPLQNPPSLQPSPLHPISGS